MRYKTHSVSNLHRLKKMKHTRSHAHTDILDSLDADPQNREFNRLQEATASCDGTMRDQTHSISSLHPRIQIACNPFRKTINRSHAHRTHRQRKHPRHRHTHAHDKTPKRTPPTSTRQRSTVARRRCVPPPTPGWVDGTVG